MLIVVFCIVLVQIFVCKLVQQECILVIVFWFLVILMIFSLLMLFFGWIMLDGRMLVLLICIGVLGGVGQILLILVYCYVDVFLVVLFEYFLMLLVLVFGWLVFDEIFSIVMLMGVMLVIIVGILIIWCEYKLGFECLCQCKVMMLQGQGLIGLGLVSKFKGYVIMQIGFFCCVVQVLFG